MFGCQQVGFRSSPSTTIFLAGLSAYVEMTRKESSTVPAIHEFRSVHGDCPEVPDNLSLPQFFLDFWHPLRPIRPTGSPWFIDDEGGRTLDYEQVRRTLPVYPALPSSHPLISPRRSGRRVTVSHRASGRGGIWVGGIYLKLNELMG